MAELKAVMSDPVTFFEGMPARMKDEYKHKWSRFRAVYAERTISSQYEAGVLAGELTMELVLLIAGLVATGAAVIKLASKAPQLVEWAGRVRTPPRASSAGGAAIPTASSKLQRGASAARPEPISEALAGPESLPPRQPAATVPPKSTTPAPVSERRSAAPSSMPTVAPPLTKADGGTMLREAVGNLKKMPPQAREAQFRRYRDEISAATNGQWSAKQWPTTMTKNGSVYAGEGGEALVFDDAGNMYRGHLGNRAAFAREPGGLLIDYSKLKPL